MSRQIVKLLINLLLLCTMSIPVNAMIGSPDSPERQSKPIQPTPCKRALDMPDSGVMVTTTLAEALRNGQLTELTSAKESNANRHLHFLQGLALALEEYYTLELSYPNNVDNLMASGYLSEGWQELGCNIIDFDTEIKPENQSDICLTYVPQPLGMNRIIVIPGGHCLTMRVYDEYSIIVRDEESNKKTYLTTKPPDWLLPFLEIGFECLLHFNHQSKGRICENC